MRPPARGGAGGPRPGAGRGRAEHAESAAPAGPGGGYGPASGAEIALGPKRGTGRHARRWRCLDRYPHERSSSRRVVPKLLVDRSPRQGGGCSTPDQRDQPGRAARCRNLRLHADRCHPAATGARPDMSNPKFRFETGAVTHDGCVRDHNEDRYLAAPQLGIWLVADGMGGHFGGDVAAQTIVDRVARANADIRALSARNGDATVGATLAALLIHEANFSCSWCGDSRVYLLRDSALTQMSRDHTE